MEEITSLRRILRQVVHLLRHFATESMLIR